MNIDWNEWMKEHRVYIPTAEEIAEANRKNQVKVTRLRKELKSASDYFEMYKKKLAHKA